MDTHTRSGLDAGLNPVCLQASVSLFVARNDRPPTFYEEETRAETRDIFISVITDMGMESKFRASQGQESMGQSVSPMRC